MEPLRKDWRICCKWGLFRMCQDIRVSFISAPSLRRGHDSSDGNRDEKVGPAHSA